MEEPNTKELKGISFIIPTLNEETMISSTINAITSHADLPYEVIVVDNGSKDRTRIIAKENGALTFENHEASIAELRNIGAKRSKYEVIAFLDADVTISDNWFEEFKKVFGTISNQEFWITGYRCRPTGKNSFFDKHWFSRLSQLKSGKTKYINSGHMITSKSTFYKIGGFDSSLTTSEDVDFCVRAQKIGVIISQDSNLVAYHSGYPKTAFQFIQREAWHGKQDFQNLSSLSHSKVGILALLNITLAFFSILFSGITKNILPLLFYLMFFSFLSLAITIYKFGFTPKHQILPTTIISALYIIGRSLSPTRLFNRHRT